MGTDRFEKVKKCYDFLAEKSNNNEEFSVEDMVESTGWSKSTVRTYLNKNFWKPYVEKTDGHYTVKNFGNVSSDDFIRLHSQTR